MKGLIEEILQIPVFARKLLQLLKEKPIELPKNVNYVGMGSSYYAPLTIFYCGAPIQPTLASEFFYYLKPSKPFPLAVLISQSGESSETVWNIECYEKIIAITNNPQSTIAKAKNCTSVYEINAGEELCSSTKTYVNTLIVLYSGFGFNVEPAVSRIENIFAEGQKESIETANKIFKFMNSNVVKGRIIIGSGPNYATAMEGALTFSETTRQAWTAMSVSGYDHGPKECADDTILIILNSQGKDAKRIDLVKNILKSAKTNVEIVELVETELSESLSPLSFIVRLNLIMNALADLIYKDQEFSFKIGGKVTIVENEAK